LTITEASLDFTGESFFFLFLFLVAQGLLWLYSLELTRVHGRGLCALIQAETATRTIDFDYAGYAGKRFSEYDAWRKVHDGNVKSAEDMSLREKNWARP
jgi:hypothetical protein